MGSPYLRWIALRRSRNFIQTAPGGEGRRPSSEPGPDFTPTLKRTVEAFTFSEAGGQSVTLKGSGNPDQNPPDDDDRTCGRRMTPPRRRRG